VSVFENATEIQNHLVRTLFQRLELLVGCQEYYNVGRFVGFLIGRQLKNIMRFDVWLYNQNVGVVVALHHPGHYEF
jgi:hypothetical protein